jgi:hypothetical protein
MSLTSFTCTNCGAPIKIDESTRFIPCIYCNTQLEIQSDAPDDSEATEPEDETARLASEMALARLNKKLEKLDQEWEDSPYEYPSGGWIQSSMAAALGIGLGLVSFNFVRPAADVGWFFIALGILFALGGIAAGIGSYIYTNRKRAEYDEAEQEYNERREKILEQIRAEGGDTDEDDEDDDEDDSEDDSDDPKEQQSRR